MLRQHRPSGAASAMSATPQASGRGKTAATAPGAPSEPSEKPCPGCGIPIAVRDARCIICERKARAREAPPSRVLLHWLLITAIMTAIFAAGYILSP